MACSRNDGGCYRIAGGSPAQRIGPYMFFLAMIVSSFSPLRSQSTEERDATGDATGVRVLSYNIRYLNDHDGDDVWENRRTAVIDTILRADIVGLQEVVLEQLEDIEQGTQAASFDWYGVGRNDGRQQGEMTAIGWRSDRIEVLDRGTFWLSPTPERPGSRGWDAALPRIASWVRARPVGGPEFFFLNTHFDHQGKEARRQSAMLLKQWIVERSAQHPVMVTGDFNSLLTEPPMQVLLSDAQLMVHARDVARVPDPGPDSTWNGFRQIEPGRRIDFLLVTPSLRVQAFRTLDPRTPQGRFASDHLPLWALVILEPPVEN
ncbi:MAG: endonuclease [Pirellulaceae bacterium]|nr:MAG: endonuclease [Pirellulaceae bacterium]